MNKKLLAAISLLLAFAMLFAFAGCDTTEEEEESTTIITAKTPLPTDITTSYNEEESVVVTDTTYSPEALAKNTQTIFEYFNLHINDNLKKGDAKLTVEYNRGIGKTKVVNENGEEEEIPYSDNEYINAAINTLDSYMIDGSLADERAEKSGFEYGEGDLADYLPVAGADYVSALTLDDVQSATCVDNEGQRVITVTLKTPVLPATMEKAFNLGDVNAVMEEFKKAEKYLTFSQPTLTYVDCKIIITANVETDEVHTIEYVKNIDVKTTATGQGNLADVKPTDVSFRFNETVKYLIDRTDPASTTVAAE